MSKRPELVDIAGWRRDDAAAVAPSFNIAAALINGHAESQATLARRLRLLAGWCLGAAERIDGRDPELEAIVAVDKWLAHNFRTGESDADR